jgi:hypothetical protein
MVLYNVGFEVFDELTETYSVIYQGINVGTARTIVEAHKLVSDYIDRTLEEAAEAAEFDLDF